MPFRVTTTGERRRSSIDCLVATMAPTAKPDPDRLALPYEACSDTYRGTVPPDAVVPDIDLREFCPLAPGAGEHRYPRVLPQSSNRRARQCLIAQAKSEAAEPGDV